MNDIDCAKLLLTHEDILIVTHRNPDGDTSASAAALCSALRRGGRRAWLFPNLQMSRKLKRYCEKFFAPEDYKPKYVVAVDAADEKLLCEGFEGKVDLCIDHHPSNTYYAVQSLVRPERASCAEVVMQIMLEINADLTKEEATLLYLEVKTIFFRKVSEARLKLESMIYNNIRFYRNGAIAVAIVTQDMLREAGAEEEDLDNLAALAGRCESSRVNITIREKEDGSCRVSVRSFRDVDSCAICAVFGGGGHAMAAGCTVKGSPEHVRDLMVRVTEELWQ